MSIFKLPQELLVSIIELAVFELDSSQGCSDCSFRPNAKCAKALSRVCWRISRIAQPLLFHTISFDGTPSIVPPKKSAIRLHLALRQNPSLGRHCRRFSLGVADYRQRPTDWSIAKDLAKWLTRVRCFECYGGFETSNQKTWDLIQKMMQKLESLQHWKLSREGWGLHLQPILNASIPKLRILDLHGISKCKESSLLLDPKLFRSASFTSLNISDYEETPQSTAMLIQWPAQLEHFKFGSFYNNSSMMNYPMFQAWLSSHSESLKSIDIGYLSRNGGENKHIFDATIFHNLESLTISRWQMGFPGDLKPFTVETAKFLGPNVKLFGWSFSIHDQHSESWNDFGEKEEEWIEQLGRHAIVRKAALKTVKINFHPEDHEGMESDVYPWDRMDNVRDHLLRPNGMDLIYSTPSLPKEDWLNRLAKVSSPFFPTMVEYREESESEVEPWGITPPGVHGRDIRDYFTLSLEVNSDP
ncbi:hypothetical protein COCC4DRAFT_75024 [Bipolaris maydis ATCC 48331]|uniref:F-box domain-containing protein n=2 Tax=Cochliobolus heterostrophus TaxID=5016 RepID=M2VCV2_COCH5|nr:uncharacterized protein COCC4DRAFT_75024 [Bipolaris maydis ATCC 48331]EMD97558.1 hypothetical protein COCHEDRAFT_1164641 [Bipolaris maydis C5]KAJ5030997.1 hypothetical protein J3E73DRAFT_201887 [Bipolaris maydis]ENI01304.1 hypothetical protein COCC4DRAFT_75024 [Bipolaris maydis ATCC 48331]KAJ5046974.1 F-box domain protein [Bipolaris maydis]KAJ5052681.1 F-box domain protein [Bipolaris maydis]